MWSSIEGEGLENLRLSVDGGGVRADGVVLGVEGVEPFRVRYEISCDADWRVRELTVSAVSGKNETLRLLADGEGRWATENGRSIPFLDGCVDVDISATPFTNTLPIRRLGLAPGESEELRVAYLAVPEMSLEYALQRYTRLETNFYRYESLDGEFAGFTADLPVDSDGLVLDYPGLFTRVAG